MYVIDSGVQIKQVYLGDQQRSQRSTHLCIKTIDFSVCCLEKIIVFQDQN